MAVARSRISLILAGVTALLSCAQRRALPAQSPASVEAAASEAPPGSNAVPAGIVLAGGAQVSMDYLAYDAAHDRVWIPAGNTGNVDVFDVKAGRLDTITGFDTNTVKGRDGKDRIVGPSSASVGNGFVYIGNRAGFKLCAVHADTLEKAGCIALPSSPDGTAYVGTTQEVWVTTPRDHSIEILDVANAGEPKLAGRLELDGAEGYAVDSSRGLFYTNLEESDRTVVVDVKARKVVKTWKPNCGEAGPRGLALDVERRHLFVACASGSVKTLDAANDGALLGETMAGDGLDNIDYLPARHLIYAAAGRAGTLSILEDAVNGALRTVSTAKSVDGGRVVVVDSAGSAYIADSKGGRLVVVKP